MMMIGVSFSFATPILHWFAIGDFFVAGGKDTNPPADLTESTRDPCPSGHGPGVLIMVGLTIQNVYPVLVAGGCGFFNAMGNGVWIFVGSPIIQVFGTWKRRRA
jgi:hypothetical protein